MGINQIRWPEAEEEKRTEHYGAYGGEGATQESGAGQAEGE